MDTVARLNVADDSMVERPFGKYEEEAIISLALDHPEFFTSVGRFMTPEMFSRLECQYVIGKLLNLFEKHNIVPTREILRDHIEGELTEDEPFESILELVDRPSNPREVPIIKDTLLKWAKDKAFGLLYSEEAQDAYARGDYSYLEQVLMDANKIADVSTTGFWFFENYPLLFEKDILDHRTTGFARLDAILNNGGPSPKEVVCWMAPTNVGKCHSLKSKIIEKRLSRIYQLEMDDGSIIKLAGFQEIQTTRGMVKICDLKDGDDITSIPAETDGDISLPIV